MHVGVLAAVGFLSGCYLLGTDRRFNYDGTLVAASRPADASTLQQKLESLELGSTDWRAVQALFGEPDRERDSMTMKEYWWPSALRTLQHAEYPGLGVSFWHLTNPSRLYAITFETKDVVVRSLRVGHTLQDVRAKMGEGGCWLTTEGSELFWLDFERYGLRFFFRRDQTQPQFPMVLAKPHTVVKIERYDRTVEFFEGWVNVRFFTPSPVASGSLGSQARMCG